MEYKKSKTYRFSEGDVNLNLVVEHPEQMPVILKLLLKAVEVFQEEVGQQKNINEL